MTDWKSVPKTELHLHLEGAAPPDFIREMATEKGTDLSRIFNADGSYKWADFAEFLKIYEAACSVLQSPDDYRRLLEAVLDVSADNGVIYTEIFLAPDFCGGGDLGAWKEYLAAFEIGADNAKAKHGIETRFISTCVRHFGPEKAVHTADITAKAPSPRMVGFGMGGEERDFTAQDFVPAFAIAAEAGLGITSHAGEICGADSVRDTLDHLPVSRIGHGVRSVEDPDLVKRLADEDILLEVNPGSNVCIGVFPSWEEHPLDHLRQQGVPVCISTDDPPYFHITMTSDYENIARTWGWGEADFAETNRAAMKYAFCDDATRDAILTKFQ